jgi:CheY-like chemotaxis protein
MKPKVLVVEDEEPIRLLLREILERAGYLVVEAFCAREGYNSLIVHNLDTGRKHGQIDLIVSDIRIPGTIDGSMKNGFEMIKMAKKEFNKRKIVFPPVIFMSGNLPEGLTETKLLKIGDAFFVKASDFISLISEKVAELLASRVTS